MVKLKDSLRKDFKPEEYLWIKEGAQIWVEIEGDCDADDLMIFIPCLVRKFDSNKHFAEVKEDGVSGRLKGDLTNVHFMPFS